MELFDHLALGFSVAFTAQNLMYAFVGCLLGTLIGVLPGGAVLSLIRQRCLPGWGARWWWPPLTAAVGSIGCWLRWTGWYIFRRCPIPWGIRISKRYWRQRCARGIVCAHSVCAGRVVCKVPDQLLFRPGGCCVQGVGGGVRFVAP
jgi:hypothetical protein